MSRRTSFPTTALRYRLGVDALSVSPICLGMTKQPSVVEAAYEVGINFFFVSADLHWPLYESTRVGLQNLIRQHGRDRVVVAVAVYTTQPNVVEAPVRELLSVLPELEYVDLLVLGSTKSWDFSHRLPGYLALKNEARHGIRSLGASFHDRDLARGLLSNSPLDMMYVRYNPMHPGARHDLFPFAEIPARPLLYNFKSTRGYMSRETLISIGLGDDNWVPEHTDFYRFALTRPQVDGLLVALREPKEVEELARALELGPLSEEEDAYMCELGEVLMGRKVLAD